MNILLGDIGGTYTRFAFANGSDLRDNTFTRYPNANWNHFDEIIESHLRERSAPRIEACWIAVGGKVSDDGRTADVNHWNLDAASIERARSIRRVEFIHDARALANSLPIVDAIPICGTLGDARNRQILVVNLGTGFNTCSIRVENSQAFILDANAGLAHMPVSVRDLLYAEIGDAAADFITNADLFDGRRAAVLARAVVKTDLNHDRVMQSFRNGQAGRIYASALGTLTQSLIYTHLPGHGIFFAGGMARSVLGSTAVSAFIEKFWQNDGFGIINPHNFPVSLIKDDMANIRGCLRYAWESK